MLRNRPGTTIPGRFAFEDTVPSRGSFSLDRNMLLVLIPHDGDDGRAG